MRFQLDIMLIMRSLRFFASYWIPSICANIALRMHCVCPKCHKMQADRVANLRHRIETHQRIMICWCVLRVCIHKWMHGGEMNSHPHFQIWNPDFQIWKRKWPALDAMLLRFIWFCRSNPQILLTQYTSGLERYFTLLIWHNFQNMGLVISPKQNIN